MLFKLLAFSLLACLVVAAKTNTTTASHEQETNGYAPVDEDVTNESCTEGLPEDECTFRSQGKGPKENIFIMMIKTYVSMGFSISEKRPADMSTSYEICCHGTIFYLVMKPKDAEETPKPKPKKSKKRKFTPAERAKLREALIRLKEKRRRERKAKAASEQTD